MTDTRHDSAPASAPTLMSPVRIPPFDPLGMRRELTTDRVLRWVVTLLLVAAFTVALAWDEQSMLVSIAIILMLVTWVWFSSISARVARALPRLTAMVQLDLPGAETMLAFLLRRRPLQPSVRLMLYHRLASLRHRQQRFAEAAAISETILAQPLGAARDLRPNLLLIAAESHLRRGDVSAAAPALGQLHHCRLSLVERLQLLALQTQYEVRCGYFDAVLTRLGAKVQLVELMPAPQAGGVHAMLAVAARRSGRADLAHWLQGRAQLLATTEELQALS